MSIIEACRSLRTAATTMSATASKIAATAIQLSDTMKTAATKTSPKTTPKICAATTPAAEPTCCNWGFGPLFTAPEILGPCARRKPAHPQASVHCFGIRVAVILPIVCLRHLSLSLGSHHSFQRRDRLFTNWLVTLDRVDRTKSSHTTARRRNAPSHRSIPAGPARSSPADHWSAGRRDW
jgi:hypothetical protein